MPKPFPDLPPEVPEPLTLSPTLLSFEEWRGDEASYAAYLEKATETSLEPERSLALAALAEWRLRRGQ